MKDPKWLQKFKMVAVFSLICGVFKILFWKYKRKVRCLLKSFDLVLGFFELDGYFSFTTTT
jgi:hypothetical protein